MGKSSRRNWEDVYYDGIIDERYEVFDEEQQKVVKAWIDDGWDKIDSKEHGYIEDYSDEYYIKLKNGEINSK